mgnify:CR=1 FL=1
MSNKFTKERDDMIQWMNEPINETDIYFDVASKYYEDLIDYLNQHPRINLTIEADFFKIKFFKSSIFFGYK